MKMVDARFFLQPLEHERNLNTRQAARKNRWRQGQGDPK